MSAAFQVVTPEWLEARRYYLGGTDMAAIVGYGFKTALDVYRQKVQGEFEPPTLAMRRGTALEPLCRELYEEETGNKVEPSPTVYHPDHLWLACNPDGLVGDDGMTEFKTYDYATSAEWEAGIPPRGYKVQVQHGLWITGREWCDFGAFNVSASKFKVIREYADRDVQALLFEYARRFRDNHWIPMVPPPPVGKDWEYIRSLYPTDTGEQILGDDEDDALAMRWRELVIAKKPIDAEIKEIKTHFAARMKDASLLTTMAGNITYRANKSGKRTMRNDFEGEEE
jgi:putative phage-type endonuclease